SCHGDKCVSVEFEHVEKGHHPARRGHSHDLPPWRASSLPPSCSFPLDEASKLIPSEGGPYTNGASSTLNCNPAFLRPAFTMTLIAIVGAPTFSFLRAAIGNPKNRSEDRPLHERERRARCIVPLHGQPSQLNLDERRMRGRARGQRATGEHAGGGHAGAKEGLLAIGGRRAAHLAFH